MKKISVIVPFYNSEKYLKKCIKSILNQTYSNFELILINDGSFDNSISIINEFDDKRIKIYNRKNYGVGNSRNFGLLKATGEYICFIDSDDYIDNDYLEILVEILEGNSADIVCCSYKKNSLNLEILNSIEAIKNCIKLPEKIPMSVVGKIYRKKILNDIPFVVSSFLKAKKIIYYEKNMYHVEKRDNSWSKYYQTDDRLQACLIVLSKINNQANNIKNDYITYSIFNAISIVNMMILKLYPMKPEKFFMKMTSHPQIFLNGQMVAEIGQ